MEKLLIIPDIYKMSGDTNKAIVQLNFITIFVS